ncbi:MAG: methyl-accepting chemotaxis protein, partial [Pannonibacter indicus]
MSISLITAVGLLVVGAAFWWSQSKVEDAFRASEANTNLARAAYDFAGIAKQMQIEEKLYLSAPSAAVFDSFKAEAAKAEAGIAGIAAMPAAKPLANETADVQDTVSAIGGAFAELHAIQEKIGFDGSSGLRADLTVLADKAKNRINDELKFGGASDFEKLVRTVMEVQLAERKFTLSGGGPREEFDEAFAMYTKMLGRAYIPNEV